ncbi:MAG: hypothetical protein WBP45_07725, partial [Daejeonella sp.]
SPLKKSASLQLVRWLKVFLCPKQPVLKESTHYTLKTQDYLLSGWSASFLSGPHHFQVRFYHFCMRFYHFCMRLSHFRMRFYDFQVGLYRFLLW